jgi:dihydropteroate synthase
MIFKFGNIEYDLSVRTHIMGILNITPDSFFDGGKYYDGKINIDRIISDAIQMEKDGADFIDVGGESTRPGAEEVTLYEELSRVLPVISKLKKRLNIPISIDTYKSSVAEEALKAGATIVNDISGFNFDKKMPEIVSKYNASCILMHIKGTPNNMQENPEYENVIEEIKNYFISSINTAKEAGINQIIIDPGIGFGKTLKHNLMILKHLGEFKSLGYPILLGVSNKSFIDKIYPAKTDERLEGTITTNTYAIFNGANIIRVHNVLSNKRAARIADALIFNGQ